MKQVRLEGIRLHLLFLWHSGGGAILEGELVDHEGDLVEGIHHVVRSFLRKAKARLAPGNHIITSASCSFDPGIGVFHSYATLRVYTQEPRGFEVHIRSRFGVSHFAAAHHGRKLVTYAAATKSNLYLCR